MHLKKDIAFTLGHFYILNISVSTYLKYVEHKNMTELNG